MNKKGKKKRLQQQKRLFGILGLVSGGFILYLFFIDASPLLAIQSYSQPLAFWIFIVSNILTVVGLGSWIALTLDSLEDGS